MSFVFVCFIIFICLDSAVVVMMEGLKAIVQLYLKKLQVTFYFVFKDLKNLNLENFLKK